MLDENLRERIDLLESELKRIRKQYEEAMAFTDKHPRAALNQARIAVEAICKQIYNNEELAPGGSKFEKGNLPANKMELDALIKALDRSGVVPKIYLIHMTTVQHLGNFGSHDQGVEAEQINTKNVKTCLEALSTVVDWYFNDYHKSNVTVSKQQTSLSTASAPSSRSASNPIRQPDSAKTYRLAVLVLIAVGLSAAFGFWMWARQQPAITPHTSEVKRTPGTEDHGSNAAPGIAPPPQQPKPSFVSVSGGQSHAAPADSGEMSAVAVLYFENLSSANAQLESFSKGLQGMLTTGLSESGKYKVVERERIEAVLKELNLSQGQAFDQATVAKIGKLIGAKRLVFGSILDAFGQYRVDARMVEVETGQIVCAASGNCSSDKMFDMVNRLVQSLTKDPGIKETDK